MVHWEGLPTGFGTCPLVVYGTEVILLAIALHEPYVLAFEPSFVEIRHIETGQMTQVIQGANLRLLFADTPPSVTNGGAHHYPQQNPYG